MSAEAPRWFGASLRRKEDPRLLRGQGRYVADSAPAGTLDAAILRSSHAHARIAHLDARPARRCPGVVAVYTAEDLVAQAGRLPILPILGQYPEARSSVQPALAQGRVRYQGEPVAIVVAADRYTAEDALEAIAVEYEPLPVVADVEAALAPGAPLLHDEWGENVAHRLRFTAGDAAAALVAAPFRLRGRFRVARQQAVPLEGRGLVAAYDAAADRLTIWVSSQFPSVLRSLVAQTLGLAPERLRVVSGDVGVGFGSKSKVYPEDALVPLVAMLLGRPVRWLEDHHEAFLSSIHASEQRYEVEVGFDAAGTIRAMQATILTDNGAYLHSVPSMTMSLAATGLPGPYRIPHYAVDAWAVVTNKVPLSTYRGPGATQAAFVMEGMVDRVARHLGLDPAEVRLRNVFTPAELPVVRGWEPLRVGPITYDSGDYPGNLRAALAALDYAAVRAEQARLRAAGRLLGVGLAYYVEPTGMGPFETAIVRLGPDGATLVSGAHSQGQGHETTLAQICADELGLHPDEIVVEHGDSDALPEALGSYASRSAVLAGSSVRVAAGRAREELLRRAAARLEVSPADLRLDAGQVAVVGAPGRALSVAALTAADAGGAIEARGRYDSPGPTFATAVHAAVVEVERETGRVLVRRYVVVDDCGRPINPLVVEGQLLGAYAQGIGAAFLEELLYDEAGQLVTASLLDYLLPTATDVPTPALLRREAPARTNPDGIKGAGESGIVGVPAALANAVADALAPLGVVVDEYPLTPQRVWAWLQAAAANPR